MKQEPYYIVEFRVKTTKEWSRTTPLSKFECESLEKLLHSSGRIARIIKVEEKIASF